MLRNRYSAIDVKHGRAFLFFLFLIFSNHKLINLSIIIDLFVRVFVFCKYALVVFLSEINVPSILLHSILLFFVLFNEIFIKIVYLLRMYSFVRNCRGGSNCKFWGKSPDLC